MKWLLKLIPTKLKVWLYKLLYNDICDKGEREDTELVHVNKFEQSLLKSIPRLIIIFIQLIINLIIDIQKAKYLYFKLEGLISSIIGLPAFKRSKYDKFI